MSSPIELAIELDPAGPQPRHFGAPPARGAPWSTAAFTGSVAGGASCNCATLTLIPHCNGTHTESVAHLVFEPWPAWRLLPVVPVAACLVTVLPASAAMATAAGEDTDPLPQEGDLLVTRAALLEGLSCATRSSRDAMPRAVRALVVRTLPNDRVKRTRDWSDGRAPYFTRQAMLAAVELGVEHLVVDLPSVDRTHDEGRLTAHRIFFGLPGGSRTLAEARRSGCTITELAYVDDAVEDGEYALAIHGPAIAGDAVPSRPLLFPRGVAR